MSKKLTSTLRQKRVLKVPAPERKGNIKIPAAGWLECAKVLLIEGGIGTVKVDRLARRLKVTRGGFYYHFKSHHTLLEALLDLWRKHNQFAPADPDTSTPRAAYAALEDLTDALIHERGFDPQFDMAVREWARISVPVAEVVHQIDDQRVRALRKILLGLGCGAKEADIRAKVFYYHQMGYYALGIEDSTRSREQDLPVYLTVLCGDNYLKAAKASGAKPSSRARAMA